MPDPDPNPKVTLAGSGVLLHGVRDDGEIIPIEVTDAGELKTTGSGGGGATEATLSALNDKITTATDTPTGNDPGVVVRLVQSGPISISDANQTFAGAIPGPSDSGQLVRVIPTDAVTVDQCLGVVLATNHAPIETSGRAFVATRDKGATLQGDVTSTDFSADRQPLDVAVYQSVLPPDAAKDSTLSAISTQIDQTNISLGNISFAQTDGTQKTQITNGVDSAGVLASAPVGTEQGLIVRNIPSGTQAVTGPLTDAELRASPVPIADGGGSLTIDGTVTETNSSTIATNTGRIPAQGQALASASMPVVLPLSQAAGALALQAQFPATLGAGGGVKVDGSGTPLDVSVSSLPGSPAQEHTSAASPHAARLTDGATFYKGAVAGDNMGADLRVASAAVTTTNPVPTRSVATELSPSWVRGPEDGFGRGVMVQPTPVLQSTFANGVTVDTWRFYLTGTATATTTATSDSLATVSTGATSSSIAELTSMDSFSYRSGQSVRVAFTTIFSAAASGGFQAVGCGSNDGFAVGYNGVNFGFLVRRGGVSEIRTITITTASTTAENVTVTLNGVGTSVAVTNSGNTTTTAREIAAGNYSASGAGWDAYQFGATVIFVARQPGPLSGSYSLTATTAVGAFAQTIAGVTPTDTWTAKSSWNGDRLDGSLGANNLSGATLDPTKLSIWQIVIPYLGAGNVFLQWFDPTSGRWTTCHTMAVANSTTTTIVRNPMFRLWMRASGASNVSASSASMALFCDGTVGAVGPRVAIPPSFKTDVGNASERPLVAIRTERHYNGAENRASFRPIELAVSAGATGQVLLRFYLNPTLTAHNFGAVNALHPIAYDTSATASTGGLLVGAVITSPSGGSTPISLLNLGYTLQPGDVVGVTAQQTNGTNGTVAIAFTGILDNGSGGA